MNNVKLPLADASPEEIAAALRELARLHKNVAEAIKIVSPTYKQGKEDVYRMIRRLERNIEVLRARPEWKDGARWAIKKMQGE